MIWNRESLNFVQSVNRQKNTPRLPRMGEVWGVLSMFFEEKIQWDVNSVLVY